MNADAQLTFFDVLQPTVEPDPPANGKRLSIEERFEAFHRANPHVYEAIRQRAHYLRRKGFKRWSTKAAFEILRYDWAIQTDSTDGFKLNNILTRPYAHLLMKQDPALAGFFETRNHHDGPDAESPA